MDSKIIKVSKNLSVSKSKLEELNISLEEKKIRKQQLSGIFPTELIEQNNSLLLTYALKEGQTHPDPNTRLVDTLPNKVPLIYEKKFFTLGLEALLAYYGLDKILLRFQTIIKISAFLIIVVRKS